MFTRDELGLIEAAVMHFLCDVTHSETRECNLMELMDKIKEVAR